MEARKYRTDTEVDLFLFKHQEIIQHQQGLIERQHNELEKWRRTVEEHGFASSGATTRCPSPSNSQDPTAFRSQRLSYRRRSLTSQASENQKTAAKTELEALRQRSKREKLKNQKAAKEIDLWVWSETRLQETFLKVNAEGEEFVKQYGVASWKCLLPSSGSALIDLLCANQDPLYSRRTEKFDAHLKSAQVFLQSQGRGKVTFPWKKKLWNCLNVLARDRHTEDIAVFRACVDGLVSRMKQNNDGDNLPDTSENSHSRSSQSGAFAASERLRILSLVNPCFLHYDKVHWSHATPPPQMVPVLIENTQIIATHLHGLIEAFQHALEPVLDEKLVCSILGVMTNLVANQTGQENMQAEDLNMAKNANDNSKVMIEALVVLNKQCAVFKFPRHTPNLTSSLMRTIDSLDTPSSKVVKRTALRHHQLQFLSSSRNMTHSRHNSGTDMLMQKMATARTLGASKEISWATCKVLAHFIFALCNANADGLIVLVHLHHLMRSITDWLAANEMQESWENLVRILWLIVRHDDAMVKERVGGVVIPVLVCRLVDKGHVKGNPLTGMGVKRKVLNCLSSLALIPECAIELAGSEVLEVLKGFVIGKDKDLKVVMQERAVETLANLALTLPKSCSEHNFRSLDFRLGLEDILEQMVQASMSKLHGERMIFEVCRFICCQCASGMLDGGEWSTKLVEWTMLLDVECVNGGVYYENIPRASLSKLQIQTMFEHLLSDCIGVQVFGLFLFAYYSFKVEDQERIAKFQVPSSLVARLHGVEQDFRRTAETSLTSYEGSRKPSAAQVFTFTPPSPEQRFQSQFCFSPSFGGLTTPFSSSGGEMKSSLDSLNEMQIYKPIERNTPLSLADTSQLDHLCGFQFLLDLLVFGRIGNQGKDSEKRLCLKLMAKGLANLCGNRKNLERAQSASILPAFEKLIEYGLNRDAASEECKAETPSQKTLSYAYHLREVLWYRLEQPVHKFYKDGTLTYTYSYNGSREEVLDIDPALFRESCSPSAINVMGEAAACIQHFDQHQGVMREFMSKQGFELLITAYEAGFPRLRSTCLRQFLSLVSLPLDLFVQVEVAEKCLEFIESVLQKASGPVEERDELMSTDVLLSLKVLNALTDQISFSFKMDEHRLGQWQTFRYEEIWKRKDFISPLLFFLHGPLEVSKSGRKKGSDRRLTRAVLTVEELGDPQFGESQMDIEAATLSFFIHSLQIFGKNDKTAGPHFSTLCTTCLLKLQKHVNETHNEDGMNPDTSRLDTWSLSGIHDWRRLLFTTLVQLASRKYYIQDVWAYYLADALEVCRDLIGLSMKLAESQITGRRSFIKAALSSVSTSRKTDALLLEVFTMRHFALSLVTKLCRSSLRDVHQNTLDILIKKGEFGELAEQTFSPSSKNSGSCLEEELQIELKLVFLELFLALSSSTSLRQVLDPRLCFAMASTCHSSSRALRFAAAKLVRELATDITFKNTLLSGYETDITFAEDHDVIQGIPSCIPALIEMIRSKDANEVNLAMKTLLQLGQFNQKGLDAIAKEKGVAAMVAAVKSGVIDSNTHRRIATLMEELSILEHHRDAIQEEGGLLLLIHFLNDPTVDAQTKAIAELGCSRFGSEQVELNLALLQQTVTNRAKFEGTLAAAKGLLNNIRHAALASRVVTSKNFRSVLNMLESHHSKIQLAAVTVFHQLLSHEQVGSMSIPLAKKQDLLEQLGALCQPPEQAAATLIQIGFLKKRKTLNNTRLWHTQAKAHLQPNCPEEDRYDILYFALKCLEILTTSSLTLAHELVSTGHVHGITHQLASGSIQVQEVALKTLLALAATERKHVKSLSGPYLYLVEIYHNRKKMRLIARAVRKKMFGDALRNELLPLDKWKANEACVWLGCLGLGKIGPALRKKIRLAALVGKWRNNPIATLDGGVGLTKKVLLSLTRESIIGLSEGDEEVATTLTKGLRVLHYQAALQSSYSDKQLILEDSDIERDHYKLLYQANLYECNRVLMQEEHMEYRLKPPPVDIQSLQQHVSLDRVQAEEILPDSPINFLWIELSTVFMQRRQYAQSKNELTVVETLKDIHDSMERSHLTILDEASATDNKSYTGQTELISRVRRGDKRMVNRLLSTGGINVHIQDDVGRTALHHAILEADDFCAILIILAIHTGGAIPDLVSKTDLDIESIADEILKAPIYFNWSKEEEQKGPHLFSWQHMVSKDTARQEFQQNKINLKDHDGKTVLHYLLTSHLGTSEGVSNLPISMVRKLTQTIIAAGADVNIADDDGKTALHYILYRNSGLDHEDFVREILKHGDPNRQDNDGRTPLHYGIDATDEKLTLVQQLLQSKAECNLQDRAGCTPLHVACHRGHIDVVNLLLKHNAILTMKDARGMTALHICAQHLHLRIATVLLDNAVEVDAKDLLGRTALHIACQFTLEEGEKSRMGIVSEQKEALVQLLLRNGADLESVDNFGKRPLDFSEVYRSLQGQIERAVEDYVDCQLHWLRQPHLIWQYLQYYGSRSILSCRNALRTKRKSKVAQPDNAVVEFRETQKRKLEAAQSSAEMFKDERTQKAVNDEWQRTLRSKAVYQVMIYLIFLTIFSAIGILDTGSLRLDGFATTEGFKKAIVTKTIDIGGSTFYDTQTISDWYVWAKRPLYNALYGDETIWYEGSELVNGGQNLNKFQKILGSVRVSQWRSKPKTCSDEEFLQMVGCCFEELTLTSMETSSYGPNNMFKYNPYATFVGFQGTFSLYGQYAGAYTQDLEVNNATLTMMQLNALEKANWIDGATRAVVVEANVYNANSRKLSHIQIMTEFPASGGIAAPDARFHIFNKVKMQVLPNQGDVSGLLLVALEIVFCFFVVWMTLVEIRQFEVKRQFYFVDWLNFKDVLNICFYFVIIVTRIMAVVEARKVNWNVEDSWLDLSMLLNIMRLHEFALSIGLLCSWLTLMEFLSNAYETLYIYAKMTVLLISELMSSLAVLLIIMHVAVGLSQYILGSQTQSNQRSLLRAFRFVYQTTLGELGFSDVEDEAHGFLKVWQSALLLIYTLVVIIVFLNLLITVLIDKYYDVKKEAKSSWCQKQALEMLLQRVLQRRNVLQNQRLYNQMEHKLQPFEKKRSKAGLQKVAHSELFSMIDSDTLNSMVEEHKSTVEQPAILKLKTILRNLRAVIEGASNSRSDIQKGFEFFQALLEKFKSGNQLAIFVRAGCVRTAMWLLESKSDLTVISAISILQFLSNAMLQASKASKYKGMKASEGKADAVEIFTAFQDHQVLDFMIMKLNVVVTSLREKKKGDEINQFLPALQIIADVLHASKVLAERAVVLMAHTAHQRLKQQAMPVIFLINRWAPDWYLKAAEREHGHLDSWELATQLVRTFYVKEVLELLPKGPFGDQTEVDYFVQAAVTLPQMLAMTPETTIQKWITQRFLIESLCGLIQFDIEDSTDSFYLELRKRMQTVPCLPQRDNTARNTALTSSKARGKFQAKAQAVSSFLKHRASFRGASLRSLQHKYSLQKTDSMDQETCSLAKWGAAKSVLLVTEILARKTSVYKFLDGYRCKDNDRENFVQQLFSSLFKMLLPIMDHAETVVPTAQQYVVVRMGIMSLKNLMKIVRSRPPDSHLSLENIGHRASFDHLRQHLSRYWMESMVHGSNSDVFESIISPNEILQSKRELVKYSKCCGFSCKCPSFLSRYSRIDPFSRDDYSRHDNDDDELVSDFSSSSNLGLLQSEKKINFVAK